QAAAAWWATGAQTYRSFVETIVADAEARAGNFTEADRLLAAAAQRIERSEERWAQPELLRVTGEVALARTPPDHDTARRLFESALECARGQGAAMWELRAGTSLGRLLNATGRKDEAEALLQPLVDRIASGGDTVDLREARQALASAANG